MKTQGFAAGLAATFTVLSTSAAFAVTEIQWWHAMTGANNEVVETLSKEFNESQSDYKVVPVFKGTYPETMTAAIALGMVLTPGPNMIYLISRSISQGRAAGLISLCGIALGFIVYMLCAAYGLTALLMAVPFLLDMVADTPVDLVVVSVPHFEALTADAPGVKLALLENLATGAYGQMAAVIKTLGRFDIGL